jgi:hypothetical protein
LSSSHPPSPRLLDTTPAFEQFAKKAFLQPPVVRSDLWRRHYEAAHPDVIEALTAECGELSVPAVVRNLSHVRRLVTEAAKAMPDLIAEIEPKVQRVLNVAGDPEPLHVLVVGAFAANAVVGRVGDDVALLHCLEWYSGPEAARVLIAHEDTHAWQRLVMDPPEADLAWHAFSEGLAVRVSRAVVPDRPENEYFWYGVEGFEEWLPWCRENHDELLERFREALDDPEAIDAFFGSGFVEGRWRVGFYVADEVIGRLKGELHELVGMSPDDAKAAVREALHA